MDIPISYKPDASDCTDSTIALICQWFKRAKPTPTLSDVNTQMGVHFEEVAEMLDTLTGQTPKTTELIIEAREAVSALADHLKTNDVAATVRNSDRVDFLDSLCDQIVTAVGSGVVFHMDVTAALDEVSASNNSKFDPDTGDPILHPQTRKIMKGPAYFKANLNPFV